MPVSTVIGVLKVPKSISNICFFLVSEKYNKETTGICIGVSIGVLVGLSVLGILYKRGAFRRCRRGNNYVSIHLLPFPCENCNSEHSK